MMNTDSAAITVDELVVDRAGTRVLPGLSLQVPSG
ncbi:MAG: hypothetical protein QOG52_1005, partial [Frankiaceae bacterium]|nr:hypothetical protein [Frankiaceae bacterium]